ncbi:isochorismatase family protein [Rathayibacter rathayi]|uniref:isochorismatase family protein n=1 Tax=Rathayibacter rathayi TaxID=33887 RepID=UPI000CE7FEA0|nr:isochorismatase family protein [Rathayibacter rathayi]PPF18811.1 isochorismatase [Rathayibacter rathayi]PPG91177.1 isochorismatase [Rathayibacter rathayi]
MTTPRRALILVDVQQEYFSGPLEIQYPPHAQSLPRIAAAIDSVAAAGLPIAVVAHSAGKGAPIFDPTGPSFALHPEIERRRSDTWKSVTKQFGSVFAGTDLLDWLREHDAIALSNDAGSVDARSLHTTLRALLNSNFAAVAPTTVGISALTGEYTLPMSTVRVRDRRRRALMFTTQDERTNSEADPRIDGARIDVVLSCERHPSYQHRTGTRL